MCAYFEINTDDMTFPVASGTVLTSRANAVKSFIQSSQNELSIAVISYNRLDKTKVCVESLIKNTNIPFHLVLIDSGSEADVLAYYENVAYSNKTIIRITKNINANFSFLVAMKNLESPFCAIVSNDVIVTPNAIENLFTCIKSAPNIGWVSPVSSNVSNLQQVNLEFETLEEMHQKAAEYNRSNPLKWQERICLMPAIFFYRKECIDIVGFFDYGFFHDFADDDMSRRINRAGYKTILCKDTWVHHDHVYNQTPEESIKQSKSLAQGRKNFSEKYYGLDAWEDFRNFETELISNIKKSEEQGLNPQILGIDTRCGTPILEIRNKLREYGVTDTTCYAFTSEAKYFLDLQTLCNEVICDKIEFLWDYYPKESFDYILLGAPINTYHHPYILLKHLFNLLKPKGTLLLKLKNTFNETNLTYSLGRFDLSTIPEPALCMSVENTNAYLLGMGAVVRKITLSYHSVTMEAVESFKKTMAAANSPNQEAALARLFTKDYLFCVEKVVQH